MIAHTLGHSKCERRRRSARFAVALRTYPGKLVSSFHRFRRVISQRKRVTPRRIPRIGPTRRVETGLRLRALARTEAVRRSACRHPCTNFERHQIPRAGKASETHQHSSIKKEITSLRVDRRTVDKYSAPNLEDFSRSSLGLPQADNSTRGQGGPSFGVAGVRAGATDVPGRELGFEFVGSLVESMVDLVDVPPRMVSALFLSLGGVGQVGVGLPRDRNGRKPAHPTDDLRGTLAESLEPWLEDQSREGFQRPPSWSADDPDGWTTRSGQ